MNWRKSENTETLSLKNRAYSSITSLLTYDALFHTCNSWNLFKVNERNLISARKSWEKDIYHIIIVHYIAANLQHNNYYAKR